MRGPDDRNVGRSRQSGRRCPRPTNGHTFRLSRKRRLRATFRSFGNSAGHPETYRCKGHPRRLLLGETFVHSLTSLPVIAVQAG